MTESVNLRELALGILMEVTKEGQYSHIVIRQVLRKYQYLDKRERAFLTRLSEGTIQYMIKLDYIIDLFSKVRGNKMKPVIRNILRMSVYQMEYMDAVPVSAVCNEAVKLAKKRGFSSLSGFVNGVLREIARSISCILYPSEEKDPVKSLSVCYSMPEWIVAQWLPVYGIEKTKEIFLNFLTEAPLTIRTNLAKITPGQLKERLASEGVTATEIDAPSYGRLSYAFTISGYDTIEGLPSFSEGLFYIQDISSMLAVEYAGAKAGDYIIDVCAAPGGKSLHLAEKAKGGMVEARDLTPYKVGLIEENIRRFGGGTVKAVQQDATVFDEASVGKADIVVADLPCSGLGVLRKKTDIKYKASEAGQLELAALQRKILDTVWAYVKPGGTLFYSTCTISRAENEENVRLFLKEHPMFELETERQLLPQKTAGDGFYFAKLVRSQRGDYTGVKDE